MKPPSGVGNVHLVVVFKPGSVQRERSDALHEGAIHAILAVDELKEVAKRVANGPGLL